MTPDRLFFLDASQLALGNKPAFAVHRAQDSAFCHFFPEPFEQLFLGFIWAQFNGNQSFHLPFNLVFILSSLAKVASGLCSTKNRPPLWDSAGWHSLRPWVTYNKK